MTMALGLFATCVVPVSDVKIDFSRLWPPSCEGRKDSFCPCEEYPSRGCLLHPQWEQLMDDLAN